MELKKEIRILGRRFEVEPRGKATQLCPFWPRRIIPFG